MKQVVKSNFGQYNNLKYFYRNPEYDHSCSLEFIIKYFILSYLEIRREMFCG